MKRWLYRLSGWLLMLVAVCGCQRTGCQSAKKSSNHVQCTLLHTLGTPPSWEGSCSGDKMCWRTNTQDHLHWARCVAHRCLVGRTDPKNGHRKGVLSVLFVDQGRLIVSGDAAGDIRMWNAQTGRTVRTWRAHRGAVRALAWTRRGFLISAGDDEVIRVWWPQRKQLVRLWKVRGRISRLAIAPNQRWLAAASTDRSVWVRALRLPAFKAFQKTPKKRPVWMRWSGHTDAVRSVVFNAASTQLLTTSDDRTIRLWDVQTGTVIRSYVGHQGWVRKALFLSRTQQIASVAFDQTIRIWKRAGAMLEVWGMPVDPFSTTRKRIAPSVHHKKHGHASDISDISASSDGRWLLTTGHRSAFVQIPDEGMTARLWERKTGRAVCHLKGHRLGIVRGAFSPDNRTFVTASEDGTMRIWSIQE